MSILRHYTMVAREDQVEPLRAALADLATKVRPLDGCEGLELYHDADDPRTVLFVERWTSREQHGAAGKLLGKEAFAPVGACLAQPPVGRYLTPGRMD